MYSADGGSGGGKWTLLMMHALQGSIKGYIYPSPSAYPALILPVVHELASVPSETKKNAKEKKLRKISVLFSADVRTGMYIFQYVHLG